MTDEKGMEVRIVEYHPGIPGYDAKYQFRVYYGEKYDMDALTLDEFTLSCNAPEVRISGRDVIVPASFKDDATIDGVKITATLNSDPSVTAYYPLMIKSWKQTFNDDFDGDEIDTSKWRLSSENYNYLSQIGEGKTLTQSDACTYVEDGKLVMRVMDGKGKPTWVENNREEEADFVDARLETRGKFAQTYGCFMAGMIVPTASNAASTTAFWLMPSTGAWGKEYFFNQRTTNVNCGEIDIMEFSPAWGEDKFQATEHWWDAMTGQKTSSGTGLNVYASGTELQDGSVCNYATVWTENTLYTYFNGELVKTTRNLDAFESENAYMIVSMHAAGYGSEPNWVGSFTEEDLDDLYAYVDYVRAYQ